MKDIEGSTDGLDIGEKQRGTSKTKQEGEPKAIHNDLEDREMKERKRW